MRLPWTPDTLTPAALSSLCLPTCSQPAQTVLYRGTIYVNATSPSTELLLLSATRNPLLGTWIRSLSIGMPVDGYYCSDHYSKMVTHPMYESRSLMLADLVAACAPTLLHLRVGYLAPIARKPLFAAIVQCLQLRTLKIPRRLGSRFKLDTRAVASITQNLVHLRALALSSVTHKHSRFPVPIVSMQAPIASLNLWHVPLTDTAMTALLTGLSGTLTDLRIQQPWYGNDETKASEHAETPYCTFAALGAGLSTCTKLQHLTLRLYQEHDYLAIKPAALPAGVFEAMPELAVLHTTGSVVPLGAMRRLPSSVRQVDIQLACHKGEYEAAPVYETIKRIIEEKEHLPKDIVVRDALCEATEQEPWATSVVKQIARKCRKMGGEFTYLSY